MDTIENYISMINTIVEKFNNNCDLKYDLILYLEINLKNGKFNDAINKENYIFICLKNEALKIYKKKYISDLNCFLIQQGIILSDYFSKLFKIKVDVNVTTSIISESNKALFDKEIKIL